MTCPCDGLGFTEIVKCKIENGRQIAQGYAQCHIGTGRGGHSDLYTMPWGWEYDPRYVSKYAGVGTHGGCKYCNMALLHLRKIAVVKDPCADVSCPTVCVGDDRYIQKCEDGACVRDRLLTRNSQDCGYEPPAPTPVPPPVDPCGHVVCAAECVGVDKYAQTCQNGVCVQGTLLEANSEDCGYEKPNPTPTPTTDTYIYAIIALMIVGTYIMLRR